MDTVQKQKKIKRIFLALILISIVLGVGMVFRFAFERSFSNPLFPEKFVSETIKLNTPPEWEKNGRPMIPNNIVSPETILHDVKTIPGYADKKISSVDVIRGTDDEFYWAVNTEQGVVTTRAETNKK